MKLKLNYWAIGIALLSTSFFSLLISSILFVVGLTINPFVFPVAITLSIASIFLITKKNNIKEFLHSSIIFILLLIVSFVLSSMFNDFTWDGQTYHQDAIYQLKNGWNPVYDHHAPGSDSFWVNHYSKGMETISATIYSTFGNIETGKSINLIFILAAFFLLYSFFSSHFSSMSKKKKFFYSFIFAFSPISINQLFTFYIDHALYALIIILITTLISIINRPTKYNFYIISSIIILSIAIKLNAFFWTGFFIISFLIYCIINKKINLVKKLILISATSCLIGVCLTGFNPYIANTIDHKNPLYPLMGNGKVDILTSQTPQAILGKSREEAVFMSLFSLPYAKTDEPLKYVFPSNYIEYFTNLSNYNVGAPDIRTGGFGVFFSWILIFSLILYLNKSTEKKHRKFYNYILILLAVSLIVLPGGWWARYVPFFYIFPLIMLLATEYGINNKKYIILKKITFVLIVLNIALSLCFSIIVSNKEKRKEVKHLNDLEASNTTVEINFRQNRSAKIKMDKRGIKYKETNENTDLNINFGSPVSISSQQFKIDENGRIKLILPEK